MKNKSLLIIILILSIVGLSSGVYFKFIKSYSEEKLQVETKSINREITSSQLKLGQMISLLEEMESIKKEHQIVTDENNDAFKKLKTINAISLFAIVVCFILFIWSVKKIKN